MTNIAIFASGSGTNAENIASFFSESAKVSICCVLCNNPDAFVIQRARKRSVPAYVFDRNQLYNTCDVELLLEKHKVDFIVLAGFLWKIPSSLIQKYPNRIINIHPALLPKFGGKGMYGHHVHQAVIDAGEHESGITIHYVNDYYDDGGIIFQARCQVVSEDTADSLAQKIHALEHEHFPKVIAELIDCLS